MLVSCLCFLISLFSVFTHADTSFHPQLTEQEQKRWTDIDDANRQDEEQWQRYRDNATITKKNIESVPYDPITLGYNEGADGDRLRHEDATIRYRAALRAKRLRSKDVGEGFNPITGRELEKMYMPPVPGAIPQYTEHEGHGHDGA